MGVNFGSSCGPVSFSGRSLLRGVGHTEIYAPKTITSNTSNEHSGWDFRLNCDFKTILEISSFTDLKFKTGSEPQWINSNLVYTHARTHSSFQVPSHPCEMSMTLKPLH
jgi:hypothetical protein